MEQGIMFECKNCGYSYSVEPDIQWQYSGEYDFPPIIANDSHGKERKELLEDVPFLGVDTGKHVFICENCGYWKRVKDISLYAPNDPNAHPDMQWFYELDDRWMYKPFEIRPDRIGEYHVVKQHYRICSKCHKKMHKMSDQEISKLTCPKCGTVNEASGYIRVIL